MIESLTRPTPLKTRIVYLGLTCAAVLLAASLPVRNPEHHILPRAAAEAFIVAGALLAWLIGWRYLGLTPLLGVYSPFAKRRLPLIRTCMVSVPAIVLVMTNIAAPSVMKTTPLHAWLYILASGVMIGFTEEFACRAVLQNAVRLVLRGRPGAAIVVASAIFGALHLLNWAWYGPHNVLWNAVSATFGGLVYGTLYYRTRSILPGAVTHSLFDIVGMPGPGLASKELLAPQAVLNTAVVAILVAAWAYWFYRGSRGRKVAAALEAV